LVNLEECLKIRVSSVGGNSVEVTQVLSKMDIIRGNIHEYRVALKNWEKLLQICSKLGPKIDDENVLTTLKKIEKAKSLM